MKKNYFTLIEGIVVSFILAIFGIICLGILGLIIWGIYHFFF
jgi:hypothetical protein